MKDKDEKSLFERIKGGLGSISRILFPAISESAEIIAKNIDERLLRFEKRILRKLSVLLIIAFGFVLLLLSVLSFMVEYLGWSKALSFLILGLVVIILGLVLKIVYSD